MRLWHQSLIDKIPNAQLRGQHRECCALKGRGWGKKHGIVDYIFKYHWFILHKYHLVVMYEIKKRNMLKLMNYKVDSMWENPEYRGKHIKLREYISIDERIGILKENCNHDLYINHGIYYKEHDNTYYNKCLDNLKRKKAILIS